MKGTHIGNRTCNEVGNQNPLSWNKGNQPQALRLELANGSFYLFPYSQLATVKFEQNDKNDLLNVQFAKHEVQITGKHLRPLGLAFHKLAVDWVRELPARFAATATDGAAYIAGIKVNEIPKG
ncbi:MAG TPA: hypothetical protein VMP11_13035 [Verrucomicrobiae bacterium]|nr:hypothetical protein [Verrucomicrobiae bacterium]